MIYSIVDGNIAEKGNHEQLMAEGGLYSEMVTLQVCTVNARNISSFYQQKI